MGALPKILQKAGYNKGIAGKWYLGLGNGKIVWNKKNRWDQRKLVLIIVF